MIQVRKREDRGQADHGWLKSAHTFSFAGYHDDRHMSFRSLRVMNEDRVAPGGGFGRHGHRDMEIISYVLEGALAHEDSMGNREVVPAGRFQKMSAGSGIEHSEFNASAEAPVHFYQIWLFPRHKGLEPNYGEMTPGEAETRNVLRLIASPEKRPDALWIDQDARVYLGRLIPGAELSHKIAAGRGVWVQVLSGTITLNGIALRAGDGAAAMDEEALQLRGVEDGEVLLFDLA